MKLLLTTVLIVFSFSYVFSQNIVWETRLYNLPLPWIQGEGLCKTSDGNFVAAIADYSGSNETACIAKFNSSGEELWAKTYDFDLPYRTMDVYENEAGDYEILSFFTTVSSLSGNGLFSLLITNREGELIEERWDYDTTDYSGLNEKEVKISASNSIRNRAGDYIFADHEGLAVFRGVYRQITKYNNDVEFQWRNNYDTLPYVEGEFQKMNIDVTSLIESKDGGYVLYGSEYNYQHPLYIIDLFISKVDSNGNRLWTALIPQEGYREITFDILQTDDGGFLLTGADGMYSSTGADLLLRKTDKYGNVEFLRKLPVNKGWTDVLKMIRMSDGGFVLVGSTLNHRPNEEDNIPLGMDFFVMKLDKNYNFQWQKYWGGDNGVGRLFDVVEDDDGNIVACGSYEHIFVIAKIEDLETNVEDNVELEGDMEAYPNPASGFTNITYSLFTPGNVSISLRDVLGRKVKSIFDGYRSEGSHSEYVGLTGLPPGVYYIVLTAGGNRQTVKFSVGR